MAAPEPWYWSLTELAEQIRTRKVSPVEITRTILDRIERLDPRLHAYAHVMAESALAEAGKAEREIMAGNYRGRLHGVPVAVKDLAFTRNAPTGAGMALLRDWVPDYDATVVERFRTAGAVLLGKLQLTEGAYADHHPEITPPVSPWGEQFWTGVSSSGSGVATIAGLCYGSLGSDTGGSIRLPSASCGVVGIKPTWGRVSRYGIYPLSETLDHIGPMCRTAADAGAVLQVVAGADPNDPTAILDPVPDYLAKLSVGIRGVRIGVDWEFVRGGAEPAVIAGIERALGAFQALGAELREIAFPPTEALMSGWFELFGAETAYSHRETFARHADRYGPGLAQMVEFGLKVNGVDLTRTHVERDRFRGRLTKLFEEVDLIIIPAIPMAGATAERMRTLGEEVEVLRAMLRYTALFDMSRNPTITFSSGFTDTGVPVGMQLVGRHVEEELLIRAAHAYQQVTDWHLRHPGV